MAVKLVQPAFISGLLDDSLTVRIDLAKRASGCRSLENFIVLPHGGVRRRPGLKFIAEIPNEGNLVPFIFNATTAYVIVLYTDKARFIVDRAILLNTGVPEEITTGLTASSKKEVDYTQSADTVFMAHETKPPFKIIRLAADDFDIETIDFAAQLPIPGNFTSQALSMGSGAGSFTETQYYVTARTDDGDESLAAIVTETNVRPPYNWPNSGRIVLTWDEVAGADFYTICKDKGGAPGFIGQVRDDGVSATFTFEDRNWDPDTTRSIPKEFLPFETDFPRVVAIFQQRLWYGSTVLKPQTLFASRVGQLESFFGSFLTRADDAIENIINSGRLDEIRWIEAFNKDLAVGTAGRHWRVFSPSGGGLAPNDIDISPENSWGSKRVQPVHVGGSLIYVEDQGSKIFDLFETETRRGLTGDNLSILAPSLFDGFEIVSMAYQRTPDPVLWCVRSDGVVLALTYVKNQDIWAWHKHTTEGLFKSVTVIPGETFDEVYFCIERDSRFFLEFMEDKWTDGDIKNAQFLDSMVSYSGAPITVVTGLDHLEGKTVAALADGIPIIDLVVVGGTVTLPNEASEIHVGLSYTSILAPIGFEYSTEEGSTLGRPKTITEIILSLSETVGGKIGPTLAKLDSLKFTQQLYGEAIEPFTGYFRVTPQFDFNTDGSFFVVQELPLPFSLQAVSVTIDQEET